MAGRTEGVANTNATNRAEDTDWGSAGRARVAGGVKDIAGVGSEG